MKRDIAAMNTSFEELFKEGASERAQRLGELAVRYNIPKYVKLFQDCAARGTGLSVLELGAGRGEISRTLVTSVNGLIGSYTATEITSGGAFCLKKQGFAAARADASRCPFASKSFDVVCAFDVMHHVENPREMAHEMARVAKKQIFLIEANGLSVGRRLLERTPHYKKLGETSYRPVQYRSFFEGVDFEEFTIRPFLFTVPGTPVFFIPAAILFSEFMERVPGLRWQCSSVLISGVLKGERGSSQ